MTVYLGNWLIGKKTNIFFRQSILVAHQQALLRGHLLSIYLGLPLIKGKPTFVHSLPIADKNRAQLNSWKGSTCSLANCVWLVDSVITSLFVHSFMIYRWPFGSLSSLNKSIWNFICMESNFQKRVAIVAWDKCCLKNLVSFNNASIAKLTWKIMSHNSFVY